MYTKDMTRQEAADWVAYLEDLIPGAANVGYVCKAGREQLAWDLQDCRDRVAELDAEAEGWPATRSACRRAPAPTPQVR